MRASHFLFKLYAALPGQYLKQPLYTLYNRLRRLDRRRSVVTTIAGIRYDLDLNQGIDSDIYFKGCYEPRATAFITQHVRPGMVALDIGANIGAHALRLAQYVGPTGRVVAFEPMSWAFARLQRNAALNAGFKLTLEQIGLADFEGARRQRIAPRFSLTGKEGDFDEEEVRFMRLDDYLARLPLGRIDFIKLDVDGFDYKVLTGALATLRQYQPLMLAELAPPYLAKQGDTAEGLLALLRDLAYEFSLEAEPGRRLATPAEVMARLPQVASSNFIAWPPNAFASND